jgi:hypothetical protein
MAEYKLASRYRVAYHRTGPKAGKTDIVVTFDDDTLFTYEDLPPETAHHLIDLLRNEGPIWIDMQSGLFLVADEPIGSGEE